MHVRPITRDDLPECSEITFGAFEKDELISWLNPGREKYPEDMRRYNNIRLRSRLVEFGQHGFVVVTEEGDAGWTGKEEVVGFAFFTRSEGDEAAKKWRTDSDSSFKKIERRLLDWEEWYDSKFLNRAQDPKRVAEYVKLAPWAAFDSIKPLWHMAILCVSPKHQRRGVGSLLVQHGQQLAADEGIPLTLEASIPGRRLYLKSGFKTIGEVPIIEGFTDAQMVWEPKGKEGTWLERIEGDRAKVKT